MATNFENTLSDDELFQVRALAQSRAKVALSASAPVGEEAVITLTVEGLASAALKTPLLLSVYDDAQLSILSLAGELRDATLGTIVGGEGTNSIIVEPEIVQDKGSFSCTLDGTPGQTLWVACGNKDGSAMLDCSAAVAVSFA